MTDCRTCWHCVVSLEDSTRLWCSHRAYHGWMEPSEAARCMMRAYSDRDTHGGRSVGMPADYEVTMTATHYVAKP